MVMVHIITRFCYQMGSWLMLPALPVQHGARRGAVFTALIINHGGRDFMSLLHATFWFIPVILFTHTDLSASESGFSSENIYTTVRNSPHTWYVLKSSALCMCTWIILIEMPTMHNPRLGSQAVTHSENHAHLCCLTSMIEASHTLTLSCPTG